MDFSDSKLPTSEGSKGSESLSQPIIMADPTFDTEDFLLTIAKYPILWCQSVGYLPLTVRKSPLKDTKELRFIPLSIPVLLCILQAGMLIAFGYFWRIVTEVMVTTVAKLYSDGITLKMCSVFILLNTFVYRLAGLVTAKSTVEFWKSNCKILDQFFRADFKNPKYSKLLNDISSHVRNCLMTLFIIAILSNVGWVALEAILVHLNIASSGMSMAALNQGFLTTIVSVWFMLFNICHPLCISWVNFFLHLYSVCLLVVSENLNELIEEQYKFNYFNTKRLNFIFTKNIIEIESLKSHQTKSCVERSFLESIEKYMAIADLVKLFNQQFGNRLSVEVVYNMGICLGFTYFTVIWISDGFYISAFTNILPCVLAAFVLMSLGDMGSRLSESNDKILEIIQRAPVHLMSEEVQWKVRMVLIKMSRNPMEITPGGFFTLNKRMITSVLSFLITSLIVLAQFRDNGNKHALPPHFWNYTSNLKSDT